MSTNIISKSHAVGVNCIDYLFMLDWDIQTGRPTHIKVRAREVKKEVLKKIAYYCTTSQVDLLPEVELIKQVETYLPDSLAKEFTAEEFIREIENSSGLLRHRTAETYEFINSAFQEYLTADYISNNRDEEFPKTKLSNPWWREVTPLLAGIMGNATPLVAQILDYRQQITEESEKHAYLFIAFSCLYEAEVEVKIAHYLQD